MNSDGRWQLVLLYSRSSGRRFCKVEERFESPLFQSLALQEQTHLHKPPMYYVMVLIVHFNLCFQHVRTRDACREYISNRNSELRKQLSQQETQPLRQDDKKMFQQKSWGNGWVQIAYGRWFSVNTQWFSEIRFTVWSCCAISWCLCCRIAMIGRHSRQFHLPPHPHHHPPFSQYHRSFFVFLAQASALT